MSCVFSTSRPSPISCDQPVITVSFPTMGTSANSVVLANGAVVDLNQLGALIAQICPAIACQPGVVQQ